MRFIDNPEVQLLYKETDIRLHVDNRDRGDIIKQLEKINDLGCEYTIEIRKKKADNSIGSFIWSMIQKIAEKKKRDPVSMYRELLSKKAERFTIYTNQSSFPAFKLEWEGRGQGYQIVKSTDYKDYIKCICVKGLSGMREPEKRAFAEELKKECKRLDIYLEGSNDRVDKTSSVYLE